MFAEEVGDRRRQSLLQLHQVLTTPSHQAAQMVSHPQCISRFRQRTSHNANYRHMTRGSKALAVLHSLFRSH